MESGLSPLHCLTILFKLVKFSSSQYYHYYYYYYYYHRFTALCILSRTTQVSRYQKGKTNLDLLSLLEQEIVSGNGIRWAICKSAPRHIQTTTPASHHSVFYRPNALPAAQPTASVH